MAIQQRLEQASATALIVGALFFTIASFQTGREPYMVAILLFAIGTLLAFIAGLVQEWA